MCVYIYIYIYMHINIRMKQHISITVHVTKYMSECAGETFQDVPLRFWRLMGWCLERDPAHRPESGEDRGCASWIVVVVQLLRVRHRVLWGLAV